VNWRWQPPGMEVVTEGMCTLGTDIPGMDMLESVYILAYLMVIRTIRHIITHTTILLSSWHRHSRQSTLSRRRHPHTFRLISQRRANLIIIIGTIVINLTVITLTLRNVRVDGKK
jgi:hypothetical protein